MKQIPDEDSSRLVTAKEMAKMMNLSARTVWRLYRARKIPKATRIGYAVRWNRKEIEEWIKAGCPARAEWEAREQDDLD